MSEKKFLSDGRKVAVIGQINSTEWIVQEIFITASGDEIPTGEKFTTKSIHDNKMETWKDREVKRVDQDLSALEVKKKNIQSEISRLVYIRDFRSVMSKEVEHVAKKYSAPSLETLFKFLDGRINFVVEATYGFKIEELSNAIGATDYGRFEGIKLLSLFGNSGGELEWRINQYRDGSGSSREVCFFETLEEAKRFIKANAHEMASKDTLRFNHIENCVELGIDLNMKDEAIQKVIKARAEGIQKNIEATEKRHQEQAKIEMQKVVELEAMIKAAR